MGSKKDPSIVGLPLKQSELMRAIRGVVSMGFSVERVEILPRTGQITVVPGPALREKELA